MERLGWKVFTIAAAAVAAAEVAAGDSASPRDLSDLLLDVPVFAGLVGYAWDFRIGSRWMWRTVFFVEILVVAAVATFVGPALWSSRAEFSEFFFWAVLLGAGMWCVKLYGLYRYGFSSSSPWRTVQPAAAAARGA